MTGGGGTRSRKQRCGAALGALCPARGEARVAEARVGLSRDPRAPCSHHRRGQQGQPLEVPGSLLTAMLGKLPWQPNVHPACSHPLGWKHKGYIIMSANNPLAGVCYSSLEVFKRGSWAVTHLLDWGISPSVVSGELKWSWIALFSKKQERQLASIDPFCVRYCSHICTTAELLKAVGKRENCTHILCDCFDCLL